MFAPERQRRRSCCLARRDLRAVFIAKGSRISRAGRPRRARPSPRWTPLFAALDLRVQTARRDTRACSTSPRRCPVAPGCSSTSRARRPAAALGARRRATPSAPSPALGKAQAMHPEEEERKTEGGAYSRRRRRRPNAKLGAVRHRPPRPSRRHGDDAARGRAHLSRGGATRAAAASSSAASREKPAAAPRALAGDVDGFAGGVFGAHRLAVRRERGAGPMCGWSPAPANHAAPRAGACGHAHAVGEVHIDFGYAFGTAASRAPSRSSRTFSSRTPCWTNAPNDGVRGLRGTW